MTMTAFDEKVRALTNADIEAAKVGVRATNVLKFLQNTVIENAVKTGTMGKKTKMELHPLSLKRIVNLIALLTTENEYPALLSFSEISIVNGVCTWTYVVNKAGISERTLAKFEGDAIER